jgi:hypothetical protein
MRIVRHMAIVAAFAGAALAQQGGSEGVRLTAVYALSDHHTSRFSPDRDPVTKIAKVCSIQPSSPLFTLSCSVPPVNEPRTGRRFYYSIALFRDLDENLYMAACAAPTRNTNCNELRAGQTFSAEVEEQIIRIVIRDEQLPMRILEFRPPPASIDSPTKGTPSQAKPTPGTPSNVPYSRVPPTRGTPSEVRPSDVSVAAGPPSVAPPSEVSNPVVSPNSARLYLYSSVGSARVYVDDQQIGAPPVDVPLVPGRHIITVRAPGFRDWVRRVETPGGKTTRLFAELQK